MNVELKAVVFIGAAALAAVEAFRSKSFGWAGLSAFAVPFAWDTAELAW